VEQTAQVVAKATGSYPTTTAEVAGDKRSSDAYGGSAGIAWASLGQKLIRTGTVRMEVEDVQTGQDRVALLAMSAGGFVAGNKLWGTPREGYQAVIVIRVPNERLDQVVQELRKIGKVSSIDIQSQDVSQEYVDLEARLRTKRQEEAILLDLMGRRGNLGDILSVERELARVRGEIEQAQGRLNYLENMVALSTLTVEMTQKPKPEEAPEVAWKLADTAKGAWRAAMKAASALVRAGLWVIITGIVWIPIIVVLTLAVWLPVRSRRNRQ